MQKRIPDISSKWLSNIDFLHGVDIARKINAETGVKEVLVEFKHEIGVGIYRGGVFTAPPTNKAIFYFDGRGNLKTGYPEWR